MFVCICVTKSEIDISIIQKLEILKFLNYTICLFALLKKTYKILCDCVCSYVARWIDMNSQMNA